MNHDVSSGLAEQERIANKPNKNGQTRTRKVRSIPVAMAVQKETSNIKEDEEKV